MIALNTAIAEWKHSPRHRTELMIHELDGEALLHDVSTANTHHLNATAYFVWRNCNGHRDYGQLADRLAHRFEVTPADASSHVGRICDEFRRSGLTDPGEPEAGESDGAK